MGASSSAAQGTSESLLRWAPVEQMSGDSSGSYTPKKGSWEEKLRSYETSMGAEFGGSYAMLAHFLQACKDFGMPEADYAALCVSLDELIAKRLGKAVKIDMGRFETPGLEREDASSFLESIGIQSAEALNRAAAARKMSSRPHVTQESMLELFCERIMEFGDVMAKTAPAMIRPAKVGEYVATVVAGRVLSELTVTDATSWVVKAPTAHQEEYVLNATKFEANWVQPGKDLAQTVPNCKQLTELGFKKFWPQPNLLKWMYSLKREDIEELPSLDFKTSWGAIQRITQGDFLAMPYPAAKANEIYIIPGDVVASTYVRHGARPSSKAVPKDLMMVTSSTCATSDGDGCPKKKKKARQTAVHGGSDAWFDAFEEYAEVLHPLLFDCRTRGTVPDDVATIIYGFQEPFNLLYRYQIEESKMGAWITAIASKYMENPYHDWKHAFDVFQFVYSSLTEGEGSDHFQYQDILVLLLAAIAHDVGHFGLTNPHLINVQADIAIKYNDKSPLENMHSSVFFQTLYQPGLNFLTSMGKDNFKNFRAKVVDAILATDMAHHFELVDRFAVKASRHKETLGRDSQKPNTTFMQDCKVTFMQDRQVSEVDKAEQDKLAKVKADQEADDVRLLLQAFMHTADLGHCARPFEVHQWSVCALEMEFFKQGDKEKELGLSIMPMMNRQRDSAAASQGFFLGKLVTPLLLSFSTFMVEDRRIELLKNLDDNQKRWAFLVETYGKKPAQEILALESAESEHFFTSVDTSASVTQ